MQLRKTPCSKIMEYRFLLNELEGLLCLNNGVSILNSSGNDDYLKLEFQVADANSRLLVHFSAYAANVKLDVWAHNSPDSEEGKKDPEGSLRYRYRTNKGDDAIDNFCWLGAHLTWQMYKAGVINSKYEKHYCKIFDAVSKSS
ncbi:MAG: hypothetical protein ACRBHB_06380 [Arenicella sp.]